jgi:hypothetical protein
MNKFDQIKLGALVRDRISKFTGIANAKGLHLNGCHRVTITPTELGPDGEEQKSVTMDVQQVEIIGEGISAEREATLWNFGDVKLGYTVADRISSFAGVAVCLTEWYSGKKRVTVQATTLHKGQGVALHEFDLNNLKVTKAEHIFGAEEEKRVESARPPGGPYPEPTNA